MPIYEEQCRECGKKFDYIQVKVTEQTRPCPECGGKSDRLYSLCAGKVWQTFETRNILPGGAPVTVRGPGQLRQLEAEHGVKMADGPPPQTKFGS